MLRFRRLGRDDLERVLRWRTSPEVTRFMNTDPPFDLDRQVRWYEGLVKSGGIAAYWIIEADGAPIGLLNLADFDRHNRRTSWGYYIGEAEARYLGGLVPPYFYNHVFAREAELHKIVAEVFSENVNVLRIHAMHGYRTVGVLADHVYKNGRFHDVTVLELTRDAWEQRKKRFGHCVAPFE